MKRLLITWGLILLLLIDIGHMNNSIIDNLAGSSFILLESNYETELLKYSRYPYSLKKRILGPNGHLSNEDAGKTISVLAKNGYKTVLENIINNKIDSNNLSISVAHRDKPDNMIEIA